MLVSPPISRRDQIGVPFLSAATPSLRAAEIVVKSWRDCKEAFYGFYVSQNTFSLAEGCPPLERPLRCL
jgi:hypothetical protein